MDKPTTSSAFKALGHCSIHDMINTVALQAEVPGDTATAAPSLDLLKARFKAIAGSLRLVRIPEREGPEMEDRSP